MPDEAKAAQTDLLLTLQMRRDGIAQIAQQIQPALQASTATDAVNQIAAEMARFYASDVVYKSYALPSIVGALHNAGIAVGGTNGEPVEGGQFLPDLQWLTPSFVATSLHTYGQLRQQERQGHARHPRPRAELGERRGHDAPERLHEHGPGEPGADVHADFHQQRLEQRDERGLQGQRSRTRAPAARRPSRRHRPASRRPARCRSAPSPKAGSYTLTATIEPVPGEKVTSNNTQTFPVTFQ